MAGGSRSRSTTKGLLICGFAAAAVYVVGDLVLGFVYKSSRLYSFKDQWISELTARGSPVRPGMLTVITIHDLLLIAFGIGVWRAGADAQNRSLRWAGVALSAAHAFGLLIHSFFPMTSRWLEPNPSDWMHGRQARCGASASAWRSCSRPLRSEDGSGGSRSRALSSSLASQRCRASRSRASKRTTHLGPGRLNAFRPTGSWFGWLCSPRSRCVPIGQRPSRASEPPRADRRELAEALSATADFGRREDLRLPSPKLIETTGFWPPMTVQGPDARRGHRECRHVLGTSSRISSTSTTAPHSGSPGLHSECAGTNVHVTAVFPGLSRRTSPPIRASRSRSTTPQWRCRRARPPRQNGRRATSSTAWRATATAY